MSPYQRGYQRARADPDWQVAQRVAVSDYPDRAASVALIDRLDAIMCMYRIERGYELEALREAEHGP